MLKLLIEILSLSSLETKIGNAMVHANNSANVSFSRTHSSEAEISSKIILRGIPND